MQLVIVKALVCAAIRKTEQSQNRNRLQLYRLSQALNGSTINTR